MTYQIHPAAETHALFGVIHVVAGRLPRAELLFVAGHLCRIVDDQADAVEAQR
jgi:hypothetical protein